MVKTVHKVNKEVISSCSSEMVKMDIDIRTQCRIPSNGVFISQMLKYDKPSRLIKAFVHNTVTSTFSAG